MVGFRRAASPLIINQVADLAGPLDCTEPDAAVTAAATAVMAELRARGRWLLIFDNASVAHDIAGWLPGGTTGHADHHPDQRVAGDHRRPSRGGCRPTRPESVAILRDRIPGLNESDAGSLAEEIGDLPLALAQAAGYMADSGMPAAEYLDLVQTRAARILDQGTVLSYPRTLAGATQLAIEKLAGENPAAAILAEICAFLAPEPVPLTLFTTAPGQAPEPLASSAADMLTWRNC